MNSKLKAFTLFVILMLPLTATAVTAEFEMVTNETAVVNHWPGLDGWINTVDDVINGNPSPVSRQLK
jgi:hypothetical protein